MVGSGGQRHGVVLPPPLRWGVVALMFSLALGSGHALAASSAALVADFVNSPETPRQGVLPAGGRFVVLLRDLSSGAPTTWGWQVFLDNGDGAMNAADALVKWRQDGDAFVQDDAGSLQIVPAQDPRLEFTLGGDYHVRLNVAGAEGSAVKSAANFIRILQADFSVIPNPPEGVVDSTVGVALSVTFKDTSKGKVTAWFWDFNADGVIDSSQKDPPPLTYLSAGTFTVKLTVQGPAGTQTITKTDLVKVYARPTADFNATPRAGALDQGGELAIALSDLSSGNPTSWTWTLFFDDNGNGTLDEGVDSPVAWSQEGDTYIQSASGDITSISGATAREKSPLIRLTRAGIYHVRLVSSNAAGASSPRVKAGFLRAILADLVAEGQSEPLVLTIPVGHSGVDVAFAAVAGGLARAGLRWMWDFGDGTTFVTTDPMERGPVHHYTSPGKYAVRLTVMDSTGDLLLDRVSTVTVLEEPKGEAAPPEPALEVKPPAAAGPSATRIEVQTTTASTSTTPSEKASEAGPSSASASTARSGASTRIRLSVAALALVSLAAAGYLAWQRLRPARHRASRA